MNRSHPPGAMKLDAWTSEGAAVDTARRKRLTIGYGIGAVTVGLALSFITLSAHGQVFEQEETIDVSLAAAPVMENEPEPEPEPKPAPVVRKQRPKSGKVALSTPKDVPGGPPAEADPGASSGGDDLDDAFDGEGGGGKSAEPPKPVVIRKPEPVAPPAPVLVAEREHSKPPTPLSQPRPIYPAEAKSDGVEDTVVVRFLVTAAGSVGDVRVVSGNSLLASAVIDAVKKWRFEPGTFQGRPVPMWRAARFPFRLRA